MTRKKLGTGKLNDFNKTRTVNRRQFSKDFAHATAAFFLFLMLFGCNISEKKPNVIFVFADEWRGQAVGYGGNKDVLTPQLDKLATEGIYLTNAISGSPVCTPYRASLLTGQYPLTNGVFVNDVLLNPEANTIAKVYKNEGYETAYIGKWHLDGHGRSSFIPEERRQGFEYWKVLECTHDYFDSWYWDNNDEWKKWDGYDAIAQTRDAISYITDRKESDIPFFLMLSWGPPHTPFSPAPEEFRNLYNENELQLRANVPEAAIEKAKKQLADYYGHISALDYCIGELQEAIKDAGMEENTLFVFTSDHGHLLFSHNLYSKQKPHEESIHVPFIIKYPEVFGIKGHSSDMLLNTPDIMPTLLSLCNISIPESVEGDDLSEILKGNREDTTDAVLITCPHPFGQWSRDRGGKEFRGVRTKRYTYASDLDGPWLLFDNKEDPYQMNNLVDDKKYESVKDELHRKMQELLDKTNDDFLPGMEYIRKWGYVVDETETVPYEK
jgi:arylsulfatase A-like enzyme